jgi:hypothetical protein
MSGNFFDKIDRPALRLAWNKLLSLELFGNGNHKLSSYKSGLGQGLTRPPRLSESDGGQARFPYFLYILNILSIPCLSCLKNGISYTIKLINSATQQQRNRQL